MISGDSSGGGVGATCMSCRLFLVASQIVAIGKGQVIPTGGCYRCEDLPTRSTGSVHADRDPRIHEPVCSLHHCVRIFVNPSVFEAYLNGRTLQSFHPPRKPRCKAFTPDPARAKQEQLHQTGPFTVHSALVRRKRWFCSTGLSWICLYASCGRRISPERSP